MDDLLTINDDNIGGIQWLRFAPRHFFTSLDTLNLVFAPGKDWIKIEMIPETGGIDQETVPDDAGEYYNVTASAQLPKERPDIDQVLHDHRGLPCLVWLKDQNGFERITGYALGELLLSHSSSSGTEAAEANRYRISFKGKQLSKATFL